MRRTVNNRHAGYPWLQLSFCKTEFLLCLFLFIFLTSQALAASDGLVRIRKKDEAEVYKGQKVSFYIQLLSSALFSGSPSFELPEMTDGILFRVPGSSIQGTETVDGTNYTSQLYEFWFFPKRSGEITLPAINIQFTTSDYLKKDEQVHRLATEPLAVKVQPVPGVDPNDDTVIVTDHFKAEQSWEPDPADGITGAAYTRTIRMEANDMASIFLPEIIFPAMDGVSLYAKQPELRDETQRGAATGYRTESATYLFEKEGIYLLPDIHLSWFNSKNGKLEDVLLPGSELTIIADPTQVEESLPVKGEVEYRILEYALVVSLIICVVILVQFRHALLAAVAAWRKKRRERYLRSEKAYFSNLENACRCNDPLKACNALYFWLRKEFGNAVVSSLSFIKSRKDSALSDDVAAMDEMLFSMRKSSAEKWKGADLLTKVSRFRRFQRRSNVAGEQRAKVFDSLNG